MCHTAFPKLNSLGEAFAGSRYQMPEEDLKEQIVKRETIKFFTL